MRAGARTVYFVDASHFVLAPFLGFLWSVARIFLRAPCGRQRFDVLGALDAVTHRLLTVTNDSSSTAESVCALLGQIADVGSAVPVTAVLDNASYQRCARVATRAQVWASSGDLCGRGGDGPGHRPEGVALGAARVLLRRGGGDMEGEQVDGPGRHGRVDASFEEQFQERLDQPERMGADGDRGQGELGQSGSVVQHTQAQPR